MISVANAAENSVLGDRGGVRRRRSYLDASQLFTYLITNISRICEETVLVCSHTPMYKLSRRDALVWSTGRGRTCEASSSARGQLRPAPPPARSSMCVWITPAGVDSHVDQRVASVGLILFHREWCAVVV